MKLRLNAVLLLGLTPLFSYNCQSPAEDNTPEVVHEKITFVPDSMNLLDTSEFDQIIFSEPEAYAKEHIGGRDILVVDSKSRRILQSIRETYHEKFSKDILYSILSDQNMFLIGNLCDEPLENQIFSAMEASTNKIFVLSVDIRESRWVLTTKFFVPIGQ